MKTNERLYVVLNLRLFDGDGGGDGGASGAAAGAAAQEDNATKAEGKKGKAEKNPLAKVHYGKVLPENATGNESGQKDTPPAGKKTTDTLVSSDTADARRDEFEKLISGEYKDLFSERVQKIIDTRFKQTKELEARLNELTPLLDMLSARYGVDAKDVEALAKAMDEDDSFYEEAALEAGMTVQQYKNYMRALRENEELKRAAQERERQAEMQQRYMQWEQQAAQTKAFYPNFDLQTELRHPETGQRFASLLASGIDVKTAYDTIHLHELLGGAMQYTAQQVSQKVVNDIRARGLRPTENGASGASGTSGAVIVKSDPRTWTRKDREEVARRVLRGEKIYL